MVDHTVYYPGLNHTQKHGSTMIFLVELLRQLAVCYVLLTTNELNSDQETNVEITSVMVLIRSEVHLI